VQRFPSPPNEAATAFHKETWQGYCEIESEPAYFNVVLREIGVQGVTVREVPMMDRDTLSWLPSPVFGLIMLFRHRKFDSQNQSKSCPPDVWFANQMPAQNSCATIAMIHALLNTAPTADIDIGEHMRQFKDFTKDLTPYQRGEAFSSWSFVKKIHNSFAKKMDILENDRYLASKVKKAERQKASEVAEAEAAANPKSKKTSKGKDARRDSDQSIDSVENFEESAHHYIAFVPINGEVWKLDGMDYQPTRMGQYDVDAPETWIHTISDRVMSLMGAGDDDYGLFAIAQSPMVKIKKQFCVADATRKVVELKLNTVNTDWKLFISDEEDIEPPSPSFLDGITEEQRAAHPIPEHVLKEIKDESMSFLLERRQKLVAEQRQLAQQYACEEADLGEEDQKAEARRWDYGPAIKAWIEMLAENGHLEQNLHLFPMAK
jgi:ubiquitin carboxyl-terminal hydrolase L5